MSPSEDPSSPPASPEPGSLAQIQQDSQGNQNQVIGQVLGGMVVYGQVIYNNPTPAPAQAPASEIGPNPYKGLLAFQETDEERFFGREKQIQELWQKFRGLDEDDSGTRLLTIYGPSGSGKSSLARAGLIPELARQPLPGRDRARVAVLVPGSHPLEALATVLARIATHDPTPVTKTREFAAELKQTNAEGNYDGLRRIGDALPDIAVSPLIVLVDQLEEVFTLCEDAAERDAFIGNLLDASSDRAKRVAAIVTLRSDFLGATQKHPRLNQLIATQGYFVAAMAAEGLREAIAKPAEFAGHPLDGATVSLLVEQTQGREGALPLLQFALTRIWAGLAEGREPAETLTAIGGVGGALAGEAQRIYGSLNAEEQEIARRVFLGLVQLGEGAKDTRRRTELERVVSHRDSLEQVQRVIARFAEPSVRLITLAANGGAETAEVTHEALFDHWQQMKDWLDGGRSDLRFQRRLDEAAMLWQENGKPEGSLWRSPDLDLLKRYQERAGGDMTPLQVEFFDASVGWEKAQKEAAEKFEKAQRRLRQMLVRGLSMGLVLTSGTALSTAMQLRQAEIGQIQTYVGLSSVRLANNQGLEADVESIRAGTMLQHSFWQKIWPDRQLGMSVLAQLQQTANTGHERNRLGVHQGSAWKVVFSPDGKLIATCGEDSIVQLWDSSGKLIAEMEGHQEGFFGVSVVFSSDGKRLATSGEDGTTRLWDSSGKLIAEMEGHQGRIGSIAFSPDGKLLATAGDDGIARLWDISGKLITELEGHQGRIGSVVFSPDGKLIATGGADGTARLWDRSGKLTAELKGHQEGFFGVSVVFSPDGKLIATSGEDGTTRLWDSSGKLLAELKGHQGPVWSVVFSPDSNLIATGGAGGIVQLWDSSGKQINELRGDQGAIVSVVFSSDGKLIVAGGADGTIRIWDMLGRQISQLKGHQGSVRKIVFSPDGKQLITSGADRTVRLWDISGKSITELKGHQGYFGYGVFSPNGKQVLTCGDDNTTRLWDISSRKITELKGYRGCFSVIFSPDSKLLTTAGEDGIARLWDTSGKQITEFKAHQGRIWSIVFSPNGKLIATTGEDRIARLWDTSGKLLAELKGHQEGVFGESVMFSPDGKLIATTGEDGIARLWNTTGKQITELNVHRRYILGLIFSPNSKLLATSEVDGTILLWDILGRQIAKLKGHHVTIKNMVFSPDSKQFITNGAEGTLRLWNVSGEHNEHNIELKGDYGTIGNMLFSPDGKQIIASGSDGVVRLWNTSGSQVAMLVLGDHTRGVFHMVFSPNSNLLAIRTRANINGVWDISSKKFIELAGYQGGILDLVFSSDSKQLTTFGTDGTVRLWQVGGIDELLSRQCDWVRDYLANSPKIEPRDRTLCNGIGTGK